MRALSWLWEQIGRERPASSTRPRMMTKRTAPRALPSLEALEVRCVPSTLPVTSTLDDVNQHGTLRYAVENAQDGDTILLTGAVKGGITLTQGELILTQQDLTIRSAGSLQVAISGDNLSRVFEVAEGASATLANLTVTGGNGAIGNPPGLHPPGLHPDRGGGIVVDDGAALTVDNCTVSDNSAAVFGGGINSYGTLTMCDSAVLNNHTDGLGGGGLCGIRGTMTVSDSTLSGNSTISGGQGGGIVNVGATLTLTGCLLSGNTASFGGGVYNFATATVNDCTLSDNTATSNGGGFFNSNAGLATLNGCTLTCNTAKFSGGAIDNIGTTIVSGGSISYNSGSAGGAVADFAFANPNAEVVICDADVSHNTGIIGGAVFNQSGTVAIVNSHLDANTGTQDGGAIYNIVGGLVSVSGGGLDGNSAGDAGGAILNVGTMTLSDGCKLSNNTAFDGGAIYNVTDMTIDHCNLTGNFAADRGGAIYSTSFFGDTGLTVSACTITSNTAIKYGGGIYNFFSTVTVENTSLITDNTAPSGSGADVYNIGTLYLDATSIIGILDGFPVTPI